MTPELLREYQFQRRHHSGWLGQRAGVSLRYARVYLRLQDALAAGVASIEWTEDPDVLPEEFECPCCRNGLANGSLQAFWCGLAIYGELVTSLSGVLVPNLDDPCCHIVESELALECEEALWHALWDEADLWG